MVGASQTQVLYKEQLLGLTNQDREVWGSQGGQSHTQDRCHCQTPTVVSLNTSLSLGHTYGQGMMASDTMGGDGHSALVSSWGWELEHSCEPRDNLG